MTICFFRYFLKLYIFQKLKKKKKNGLVHVGLCINACTINFHAGTKTNILHFYVSELAYMSLRAQHAKPASLKQLQLCLYQPFKHPHVMCSQPIGIAKLSGVFMNNLHNQYIHVPVPNVGLFCPNVNPAPDEAAACCC